MLVWAAVLSALTAAPLCAAGVDGPKQLINIDLRRIHGLCGLAAQTSECAIRKIRGGAGP